MARSAENTKARILQAATNEFAAYGIAGARIERIALEANCNKQAIYLYFGSKDGLFEAVYDKVVLTFIQSVPFDAANLPDYVLRLRKHYNKHPEVRRLTVWYEMERGNSIKLDIVRKTRAENIEAIRKAQSTGIIGAKYTPEELMLLVVSIAKTGLDVELAELDCPGDAFHEQAIIDAVKGLLKA